MSASKPMVCAEEIEALLFAKGCHARALDSGSKAAGALSALLGEARAALQSAINAKLAEAWEDGKQNERGRHIIGLVSVPNPYRLEASDAE